MARQEDGKPHETGIINSGLAVVKVSRERESGGRETLNWLQELCRSLIEGKNEYGSILTMSTSVLPRCGATCWF